MQKKKSAYYYQNYQRRMNLKQDYYRFGLLKLNYKSKKDLYENLYIKAIVDAYQRINKSAALENEIRDRFILDLEKENEFTKDLIQNEILQLDFERPHFVSPSEKRRTDIVFFISGFGSFTIECKRLFKESSKNEEYIDEGLKRFIELKYSSKESYAGMIGFIISGDILTITSDLNEKVKDCFFVLRQSNFLSKRCVNWKYSFQSKHNRINNTKIHIYHLFFEFLIE